MRTFTDNEILSRTERLETFQGWKRGAYSIWVRSSADQYDAFDDKNFVYWCEKDGERPAFVMSRNGTTNAGSYGLKRFREYNRLGCAVLKGDVIVYGYAVKGFHKRNPRNPAYVQAKSWPYFRDNNQNDRAEEIGPEYHDIIGANDHRAGLNSTVIKNWSTACMVTANAAKYNRFLDFMQSKGYPALNQVILKEANI
jgi:hypothetical protein